MRSRVPAVLLLLACVLTGAGWHADDAAPAVAKAPSASHELALAPPPYNGALPTVQAGGGAHVTGGSAAVLSTGSWPVRRTHAARVETGRQVVPADPGRSVAPARAPPGPSTR
ncbi:hypothetical protein AB0K60_21405 [Thermopolyspora sp. NPDC052614]|uniref:hypothetical protein n=1 Tax=Thermopolyspora sp. NPDC052614 TaxID=3155682 RepID=UPI00343D65CE